MAIKTTAEQLSQLEEAIDAIEQGHQSWTVDGRIFTKGRLRDYYKERARLESKYNDEGQGGTAASTAPKVSYAQMTGF